MQCKKRILIFCFVAPGYNNYKNAKATIYHKLFLSINCVPFVYLRPLPCFQFFVALFYRYPQFVVICVLIGLETLFWLELLFYVFLWVLIYVSDVSPSLSSLQPFETITNSFCFCSLNKSLNIFLLYQQAILRFLAFPMIKLLIFWLKLFFLFLFFETRVRH